MTNYPYIYQNKRIKLIKSWWSWRTPIKWLVEDQQGQTYILHNHQFSHPQKI